MYQITIYNQKKNSNATNWYDLCLFVFNNFNQQNPHYYDLTRIFHELLSRDQEDGRATGQPSRGIAFRT
jgi:hypothetical protein